MVLALQCPRRACFRPHHCVGLVDFCPKTRMKSIIFNPHHRNFPKENLQLLLQFLHPIGQMDDFLIARHVRHALRESARLCRFSFDAWQ